MMFVPNAAREELKMFDNRDIKRVQAQRPDLDDNQSSEVLGFLIDTYNIEPYNINSDRLFKETSDFMFPREL